jgi:hypothetical protein
VPRVPVARPRIDARPAEPPAEPPGAELLASLGPERKKRNKRTPHAARRALDRAIGDLPVVLGGVVEGKKAVRFEAKHLVAFYARAHEQVYGVRPEELGAPNVWSGACSAARKLLSEAFKNDPRAALDFLRWVWRREHRILKTIRDKGGDPSERRRIGWHLQFVQRSLVTDYRMATAESARRAEAAE